MPWWHAIVSARPNSSPNYRGRAVAASAAIAELEVPKLTSRRTSGHAAAEAGWPSDATPRPSIAPATRSGVP